MQGVGGRGVEVVDAGGVDHDGPQRLGAAALEPLDRLLEEVDVAEEELGVDAQRDDPGRRRGAGVVGHVAVGVRPGHAPQHRGVGPRGTQDHRQQRADHAHQDALLDPQGQGGDEGDQQHRQVATLDPPEVSDLAEVHQAEDGDHDDRGEDGPGQVVEQRGQQQQRHADDGGGHDGRQPAARAGLGVDRGAREAAGHRVGPHQRTAQVGQAEAHQLAVGVDLVVPLAGEGFGHGDRLHEAHQGDRQRDGQQLSQR